jgi:DNA-binding NarL/FixJ family response regulator
MGAVLLAEGEAEAASVSLRHASEIWRDLEMPYEEANTCLLIAAICERRADVDGRRLELDRAQQLFDQLRTEAGGVRTATGEHAARRAAGTLSERERQVLQLLAAGKTNREIGEALFISEKTVARHVSNIFDKLGVSTRAGATACAYQRNLV